MVSDKMIRKAFTIQTHCKNKQKMFSLLWIFTKIVIGFNLAYFNQ